MGKMVGKSWQESRLLWDIAFPAILTAVFQFSIGFVTVGFAGHIGEVELAAVTVVENVIEGFAYGVLGTPQRRTREGISGINASPVVGDLARLVNCCFYTFTDA
ncbi:hypothetical protein ZWY2020_036682 [Hordeum vulgare]|nr:hypothetical protein ZWY2020_036682 [Hordeum vulgare]